MQAQLCKRVNTLFAFVYALAGGGTISLGARDLALRFANCQEETTIVKISQIISKDIFSFYKVLHMCPYLAWQTISRTYSYSREDRNFTSPYVHIGCGRCLMHLSLRIQKWFTQININIPLPCLAPSEHFPLTLHDRPPYLEIFPAKMMDNCTSNSPHMSTSDADCACCDLFLHR